MKTKVKNFEERYWFLFNKFIKFIGFMFMLGGVFGFIFQAVILFDPELAKKFEAEHQSYSGMPDDLRLIAMFVFFAVAVGGYFILKARPFFPKHMRENQKS